jgi:hypothetical protein
MVQATNDTNLANDQWPEAVFLVVCDPSMNKL